MVNEMLGKSKEGLRTCMWWISGVPAAVGSRWKRSRRVELISFVLKPSRGQSPCWGPESLHFGVEIGLRHLPNDSIGALIGKGGETIGKIQKESGARIEIGKDGDKERPVTISGSPLGWNDRKIIKRAEVRRHRPSAPHDR